MARRGKKRQLIYMVMVSDYESCWAEAIFDSKSKADQYAARYKLKQFEQRCFVFRQEVF